VALKPVRHLRVAHPTARVVSAVVALHSRTPWWHARAPLDFCARHSLALADFALCVAAWRLRAEHAPTMDAAHRLGLRRLR
jgi:hypothetical protein